MYKLLMNKKLDNLSMRYLTFLTKNINLNIKLDN